MSVLFMLAWLWWALLGLVGLLVVLWFVGGVVCPPDACRRSRDRWLRQHFGEDGRRRWLANWEACGRVWGGRDTPEDAYARLGWPRRTAAGGCEGFVFFSKWDGRYRGHGPWGFDFAPRRSEHGDAASGHAFSASQHEEPTGLDWLAAGFWDPVLMDGRAVDPVALVLGMAREQVMSRGWHVLPVGGGFWRDRLARLDEELVEEARRAGRRSPFKENFVP